MKFLLWHYDYILKKRTYFSGTAPKCHFLVCPHVLKNILNSHLTFQMIIFRLHEHKQFVKYRKCSNRCFVYCSRGTCTNQKTSPSVPCEPCHQCVRLSPRPFQSQGGTIYKTGKAATKKTKFCHSVCRWY